MEFAASTEVISPLTSLAKLEVSCEKAEGATIYVNSSKINVVCKTLFTFHLPFNEIAFFQTTVQKKMRNRIRLGPDKSGQVSFVNSTKKL
jgi:hypothetical protein